MLNSVVSVFQYFLPIIVMLLVAFVLQKLYVSLLIKVGGRPLLYVPASFSVPVHELSHYLAAKLCLHKVEKVVFFQPNASQTLGYVSHSYKKSLISPLTNAVIGMAPIFGGWFVVALITFLLMPDIYQLLNVRLSLTDTTIVDDIITFINAFESVLYQQYAEPKFWAWGFLVANITVFSAPSGADFKGAWSGLVIILFTYVALFHFFGDKTGVFQIVNAMASAYLPALILCVIIIFFITIPLVVINVIKQKIVGIEQP